MEVRSFNEYGNGLGSEKNLAEEEEGEEQTEQRESAASRAAIVLEVQNQKITDVLILARQKGHRPGPARTGPHKMLHYYYFKIKFM